MFKTLLAPTALSRPLTSCRFPLLRLALAVTALLAGCAAPTVDPEPAASSESDSRTAASVEALPAFADYPVDEVFTGEPADVDLDSHPEAETYRTALTRGAREGGESTLFAGHYRIVVIGCGTSCKEVWAVDLEDGSVHSLFTASYGVAFRPDSRLIIQNDPATYEGFLDEMSVAEVEQLMTTYGPPRFWVEKDRTFEQIGPRQVRIDPETRKLVPGEADSEVAAWRCRNDVEVQCGEEGCEARDPFTPMDVTVDDTGRMSVCAYTGCWEGTGSAVESGGFLVLLGLDLEFKTSSDSPSDRADIVIAIDRADGISILKAGGFAQPMLCEREA